MTLFQALNTTGKAVHITLGRYGRIVERIEPDRGYTYYLIGVNDGSEYRAKYRNIDDLVHAIGYGNTADGWQPA